MSENWQNQAQCRDVEPDVMQPEVASPAQVAQARAVCDGCPVIDACRATAADQRSPETGKNTAYGVWAGVWWGPAPRVPAAEVCGQCGDPAEPKQRLCRRHLSDAVKESQLRLLDENSEKPCSWEGCGELRHRMNTQVSPYCKAHKAERERLKRLEKRQQSA